MEEIQRLKDHLVDLMKQVDAVNEEIESYLRSFLERQYDFTREQLIQSYERRHELYTEIFSVATELTELGVELNVPESYLYKR